MKSEPGPRTLFQFAHPYTRLEALPERPASAPVPADVPRGEALIWQVRLPLSGEDFERVRARRPGVALIVVLPPPEELSGPADLLRVVEMCRPQSILPSHLELDPMDLQALMRRPPEDLAADVTDYLAWRGVTVDSDTRHLLRRTIELSGEIRTVSALARSLYLSRRALGRRFLSRGIPVPSHWLHIGRVLRAVIALQNSRGNLFDVACDLGYPDGFALSNQMKRLADLRPSLARDHLGWEWVLESWLGREAHSGGFSTDRLGSLIPEVLPDASLEIPAAAARSATRSAAPAPRSAKRTSARLSRKMGAA